MSPPARAAPRNPVLKSMQLLRWMASAQGNQWGVREIAKALGLPPTTTHRVLAALEKDGVVHFDADRGQYGLGLEFFRLAWKATDNFSFREAATPFLQRLVQTCNESAFIGLYDRSRMELILVAAVECNHELRHVVRLNEWMAIYRGASGLAVLAFLPEPEREAIIARATSARGQAPRLPVAEKKLRRELETIREQGYACTVGQRVPGAVGIAAPIFGSPDAVAGVVGLSVPVLRFDPTQEESFGRLVIGCAEHLSEQLSGSLSQALRAAHRGEAGTAASRTKQRNHATP